MKKIIATTIFLFFIFCLMSQNEAVEIDGNLQLTGRIITDADTNSVFIGKRTGIFNNDLEAAYNVFVGHHAGEANTDGKHNVYLGGLAGNNNTTGDSNVFIGFQAGLFSSTGRANILIGLNTGYNITTGDNNLFVGHGAGFKNTGGNSNVLLGISAGANNIVGSGNVFVGAEAGRNELGSDKLYIDNTQTSDPLIYGEFDTNKLEVNGSVNVSDFLRLEPGTAPSSPELGTVYFDVTDSKLKVWTGAWEPLN